MKSKVHLAGLSLVIGLCGCASAPVEKLARPAAASQGEVLIYRASQFYAGGVSLSVGVGGKTYAELGNQEYTTLLLRAGEHRIFVRARTAESAEVALQLKAGERRCLRTASRSGDGVNVVVPILMMATGYRFDLHELPCPSTQEIAKYSRVDVQYGQ